MTEVTAPYNFVPLSDKVCLAKDLGLTDLPSQDVPEGGGMSGCIDVTMTCDTPILVNWSEQHTDKIKRFGRALPNGTPAIPGSTLRGMIRNVLEIATFGKMALVDDARTSVRDLNATARLDYGSRVSEGSPSAGFAPKTKAGWLYLVGADYKVEPCDFARIDHSDLWTNDEDFHKQAEENIDAFKKNKSLVECDMALAQNVERLFLSKEANLHPELWVQTRLDKHYHKPVNGKDKPLIYHRAARTPELATRVTSHDKVDTIKVTASQKRGTLVFTGMPGKGKHMEFFFLDPAPGSTPSMKKVEKDVWQAFLDVHERQEKPSPTWVWRKPTLERGKRIPVFYLEEIPGKVTHLGLAMMFKFPADRSIKEMIANSSPVHGSSEIDLAERIFGRLESENGKGDGWRSRVSFSWAEAVVGTYAEPENQDVSVILAKPKPGFAPAYVRQRDFKSVDGRELLDLGNKKANYRSYMDWPPTQKSANQGSQQSAGSEKEQIRGWKRYPVGPQRGIPPQNQPPTGEGVSKLRPLRKLRPDQPIRFTFRLRYHNLHPVELGALLWAITWGGRSDLRHAVGMGRPLGWGRVKLTAETITPDNEAVSIFKAAIEKWAGSEHGPGMWENSVELHQLRAMADPRAGEIVFEGYRPMRLVVGGDNDFSDAKKSGSVLPEYDLDDVSDICEGPDPDRIKMPDDASADERNAARRNAKIVQDAIQSKQAAFRREREMAATLAERRQQTAEAAHQFPVGSHVLVKGLDGVRVVQALDGNMWRYVTTLAGTQKKRVNVSTIKLAE